MEVFLLMVLLLGLSLVAMRWTKGKLSACHVCGTGMIPFLDLPEQDQSEILDGLGKVQDRSPNQELTAVCSNCHIVNDPFAKRSTAPGSFCKQCGSAGVEHMAPFVISGELATFQTQNQGASEWIECLRCERSPSGIHACLGCDTPIRIVGCRSCHTIFARLSVTGSRFRLLVPISDKESVQTALEDEFRRLET